MLKKHTQSGRSIVEVMGYMVVAMCLIAGVSKIIAGAYRDYKMSQANMQISDLAGTIVRASLADSNYSEVVNIINGNYAADTTISAIQAKERLRFIPKSYRVVGSKIFNVFGGDVQVSIPDNDVNSGVRGDQFAIHFYGLDREQCIALMSKEWADNRTVDLYAIILNASGSNATYWFWPVYHPSDEYNEKPLPVKMVDIAGTGDVDSEGLCIDGNNDIMWVFN